MKLHRKAALLAMAFKIKGGARTILAMFFYDMYLTFLGKKGPHSRRFILTILSIVVVFLTLLLAVSKNLFVGVIDALAILSMIGVERTFQGRPY